MNIITTTIKGIINELKVVEWISWQETARLTAIVLVLSILIGIIIVAFDFLFLNGRNFILSI